MLVRMCDFCRVEIDVRPMSTGNQYTLQIIDPATLRQPEGGRHILNSWDVCAKCLKDLVQSVNNLMAKKT